ncbi:MAG: hypothetical protein WAL29_12315 [Bacteroidales bacterium]
MFDILHNPIAILFLALNVFLAIWASVKPWHGFLALLIITPFPDFLKRLAFLFTGTTPVDWLVILGGPDLILLGIYLNYAFFMNKKEISSLNTSEGKMVLGLFLWGCLTIFWGVFPYVADLAAAKMMLPYIPLFFVAPRLLDSEDKIKKVIYVLIGIGLLSSIYGINQFFFGMTSFEKMWSDSSLSFTNINTYYGNEVLRPFSIFASPDTYSFYLVLVLALTPLVFTKKNPLYYIISAILLIGVITSLLRTAILIYVIIISMLILNNIYLSSKHFNFLKKATVFGVMIVSILALNFITDLFPDFTSSNTSYADAVTERATRTSTFEARIRGREAFLQNLNLRMLFGYGFCGSQWGGPAAHKFSAGEVYVGEISQSHDLVSESIVSIGLIGFLFIALTFYFVTTNAIRYNNKINRWFLATFCTRVWIIAISFFVIGCLSGGSFLAFRPNMIILWSLMGLCSFINCHARRLTS